MTALAVIDVPAPSAEVDVYGVCQRIEAWTVDCVDVGAMRDAKARLSAIEQYMLATSTEGRKMVVATMYRLRVRIGVVLGAAKPGPPSQSSTAVEDSLTKDERHQFRKPAAHADVVEEVIAESSDARPVSRRQVMEAINRKEPRPQPASRPARYEFTAPIAMSTMKVSTIDNGPQVAVTCGLCGEQRTYMSAITLAAICVEMMGHYAQEHGVDRPKAAAS